MLGKSFSLLFYLKKPKNYVNGAMPIYMRITVDGIPKEISLGRKCDVERWNINTGRAIGTKEEFKKLNEFLDTIQTKVYEARRQLIEKNEAVTSELLKKILLGNHERPRMLLEIFSEHNKKMEDLIESEEYAEGTLTHFKTTYSHTKNFIKSQYDQSDIEIDKIDYAFVSDFEFYLKREICAHNTAMKYLGDLKKIVLICVKRSWLLKDPFLGYKMRRRDVEKEFLVDNELNAIETKKFATERLSLVRDIFLFSCFTGLAYADVKKLKLSEIRIGIDGKKWLFIQRQKSTTPSPVPLLPKAC
jgi:hypothetical protein